MRARQLLAGLRTGFIVALIIGLLILWMGAAGFIGIYLASLCN